MKQIERSKKSYAASDRKLHSAGRALLVAATLALVVVQLGACGKSDSGTIATCPAKAYASGGFKEDGSCSYRCKEGYTNRGSETVPLCERELTKLPPACDLYPHAIGERGSAEKSCTYTCVKGTRNQGTAEAPDCQPLEMCAFSVCEGEKIRVCDTESGAYQPAVGCSDGEVCTLEGGVAACRKECTTSVCEAGNWGVRLCDPKTGRYSGMQACPSGQRCYATTQGASCEAPCVDGCDGYGIQRCDTATGRLLQSVSCGDGYACVPGVHGAACQRACLPECDGAKILGCDDNQTTHKSQSEACPGLNVCNERNGVAQCSAKCTGNICEWGMKRDCDLSTGLLAAPVRCSTEESCYPSGKEVGNAACLSQCKPQCSSDRKMILGCNAETGKNDANGVACGDGSSCYPDGGGKGIAACKKTCVDTCVDDTTYQTCNLATGDIVERVIYCDVVSKHKCNTVGGVGACGPQCNDSICDGGLLRACDTATGLYQAGSACSTGETCYPKGGTQPNSAVCLNTCNAVCDGTDKIINCDLETGKQVAAVACSNNTVCYADNGVSACRDKCTRDRCDGDKIEVCDTATGLYAAPQACGSGETCYAKGLAGGLGGKCKPVCVPACTEAGIGECNLETGEVETKTPCGEATACLLEGSVQTCKPLCVESCNGNTPLHCASRLADPKPGTACANDHACKVENGRSQCVPSQRCRDFNTIVKIENGVESEFDCQPRNFCYQESSDALATCIPDEEAEFVFDIDVKDPTKYVRLMVLWGNKNEEYRDPKNPRAKLQKEAGAGWIDIGYFWLICEKCTNANGILYSTSGRKRVTIKGLIPDLKMLCDENGPNQLVKIVKWGKNPFRDLDAMFYKCTENIEFPKGEAPNLTVAESMQHTFSYATKFNRSIGHWDVRNVQSFVETFRDANAFNQDLSSWNVGNARTMNGMFLGAHKFNKPIGSWNTENVTNMASMFAWAYEFNRPIGHWDVRNVQSFVETFRNAVAFNQDLGSWNVGNARNMNGMFHGANVFNHDIGSWNTENVTDMAAMFAFAYAFNQPIGNWNLSKVVEIHDMFYNAQSFNNSIGSWDVSHVSNFEGMFFQAHKFNQDISSWNVSKATNFRHLFYEAKEFNQPLGLWGPKIGNVTDFYEAFRLTKAFKQDLSNWHINKRTSNTSDMFTYSAIPVYYLPRFY